MSAPVLLTVQCVGCKHRHKIGHTFTFPMCPKCFSPCIAEEGDRG